MIIKSLSELLEADERTLSFNPLGLGGRMRPEDSAEFQQQVIARYELVPAVAEGTRQSFDQLREIFGYGVLCYDIFTVSNDHALLVFEQALRDRFIEFHQGKVTFVDPRAGTEKELAADRYEQVYEFVSRNRTWKLRVGPGPETMAFNGTLGGLREWARTMGFLRGQRNRAVEQAIARLRNGMARSRAAARRRGRCPGPDLSPPLSRSAALPAQEPRSGRERDRRRETWHLVSDQGRLA